MDESKYIKRGNGCLDKGIHEQMDEGVNKMIREANGCSYKRIETRIG